MDNDDRKVLEVLCVAVDDLPVPAVESEVRTCHGCGNAIWVSKGILAKTEEYLSENPDHEVQFFCAELIPITIGDLLNALSGAAGTFQPPSMN